MCDWLASVFVLAAEEDERVDERLVERVYERVDEWEDEVDDAGDSDLHSSRRKGYRVNTFNTIQNS